MIGKFDIKPFVKWVGGKGRLLSQLELLLPEDFARRDEVRYIEPFVGGGAMLFYMLRHYSNVKSAVINDINPDLMTCYRVVRDKPEELIRLLRVVQREYSAVGSTEEQKAFYLRERENFNYGELDEVEKSALFLFLNRTCFNGLYRVNKSGAFNVPFGRYVNPNICDEALIMADSEALQEVEIMTGDFEDTFEKACGDTFFYFDPPYRPLNATSCFNDYAKQGFGDEEQMRLKRFCDRVQNAGYGFMLSNSDGLYSGKGDCFFDDLYKGYRIDRVMAPRNVNAVASKRGKISEILVHNYSGTAGELMPKAI